MLTISFWILIIILTAYAGFKFWVLIEELITFRQIKSLLKRIEHSMYNEDEVKRLIMDAVVDENNKNDKIWILEDWFEKHKKQNL